MNRRSSSSNQVSTGTTATSASLIENLAIAWRHSPASPIPSEQRGQAYLQDLEQLVPSSSLIALRDCPELTQDNRAWIGQEIHRLNWALYQLLIRCQECLQPSARPNVAIFAAPLALATEIKGFCNVALNPMPLLIDVGQIHPQDWLAIVAHEYAHAIAGDRGHGTAFQAALSHLCLGLGLLPPPLQATDPALWRIWPPCRQPSPGPGFWRGAIAFNLP